MLVREAMTRKVHLVSSDDSLQHAASLMGELGTGVLPVKEGARLVGILTDRDIAVRAVAKGVLPATCKVREVMSPKVKFLFEDESLDEAAHSMAQLQLRRMPVVDRKKQLVGILSLGDVSSADSGSAAGALREICKRAA